MSKLVIVESPAKCQKIQGFLGKGWCVIASFGHIRGLEQNLDFIKNDFDVKYEFLKEKAKAIKQLKECAKESSEIYLASDKDFEGEQIAYSVCLLLKCDPNTTKRITFTEITEKAIKHAINNPGTIDMNRVYTQQTRAIMDMMIGFTMSPLLWRYVAPSLSAGRCQTPAIRLVVEREDSIKSFKSSSSWKVSASWKHPDLTYESVLDDELNDEESSINYMENIYQTPSGTILSKETKPWTEKSPQPLITSTLQQQASALYSSNPKNTMKIAQRLYEAGHITYMRTDKAIMSEEAKEDAKKWVTEHYGPEYVQKEVTDKQNQQTDEKENAPKKKRKPKVGKVEEKEEVKAQEAHEAIRPTHMEIDMIDGADWTATDKKVYRLIWQRAIQSIMSSAEGEYCRVKTQIVGDDDFVWSSQWKRTTFEGWRSVGKIAEIDDDEESDESKESSWDKLSKIQVGDQVKWVTIKAEPKETKAQGRYTEATLVRELEKHGIGRPSTFASLLSVIQEKNYVETTDIPAREQLVKEYQLKPMKWPAVEKEIKKKVGAEKNKLVPTDLGRSVLHFMLKHFEDLFNYGFTAKMEKKLDDIAEGTGVWKQVLREMWGSYKDRYEELCSKQTLKKKEDGQPNAKIHEFSKGLKAVQSKKGPLLLIESEKKEDTQFLGWPSGILFEEMTEEIALKFKEEEERRRGGEELAKWNGHPIIKKSGKFGVYLQCGELSIPFQEGEETEKTIERFEAKKDGKGGKGLVRQFKEFVIRTGQYGPYIMKTSLKTPQFISLPKDIDIEKLTEKEVGALYKIGLEAKKNWNKNNKK